MAEAMAGAVVAEAAEADLFPKAPALWLASEHIQSDHVCSHRHGS